MTSGGTEIKGWDALVANFTFGNVKLPFTIPREDGSILAVAIVDGLDGLQVDCVVQLREGIAEVVELRIRPAETNWLNDPAFVPNTPPRGGLTTRSLRKVHVDAIKRALRDLLERPHPGTMGERRRQDPNYRLWAEGFHRRPGRGGRSDLEYAQLARDYVELLCEPGASKQLADSMFIDPAQVRNLLTEARRRELLSPAPRGRQGGELTQKALDILEREEG